MPVPHPVFHSQARAWAFSTAVLRARRAPHQPDPAAAQQVTAALMPYEDMMLLRIKPVDIARLDQPKGPRAQGLRGVDILGCGGTIGAVRTA